MKMLLFLFLGSAFAQNSCYYAAGKRAGSAIVPCSSGASACCQLGDLCLADSACWNPQYNVTYLYGCTDPTYENVNCPWKCGPTFDTEWVGVEYCANTTRNEWTCTHPPEGSEAIVPNDAQLCTDDSIVAFAGPVILQPILSLPTLVGESTGYFSRVDPTSYLVVPGYTPTTTPQVTASIPTTVELVSSTSTPISTSSRSSSGITSSASRTSSKPASSGADRTSSTSSPTVVASNSGLSLGAKAGIGAGVGGAAIAIAAIVIAWMCLRRKKPSQSPTPKSDIAYSAVEQGRNSGPSELPPNSEKYGGKQPPAELPPEDSSSSYTPAPTYSSCRTPTGQKATEVHEMLA